MTTVDEVREDHVSDHDQAPGAGGPARLDPPSYGIDSPAMVLFLAAAGVVFLIVAAVTGAGQGAGAAIGPVIAAVLCLAAVGALVRSSRVVKPKVWVRELDALDLRGTERALDAGCGRGLVTVLLAERLPRGSVVGIDLWRSRDQTGNSRTNAEQNLAAAGVDDRVELVDGDLIDLPFADREFDVVTASLALHHLPLAKDRGEAMQELMRVTRRGGRIVIFDSAKTFEYDAWLQDAGWEDLRRRRVGTHYPPAQVVTARKPR